MPKKPIKEQPIKEEELLESSEEKIEGSILLSSDEEPFNEESDEEELEDFE